MALREINIRTTTVRVFLKQEGVDTVLVGDAIDGDQSSLQMAVQLAPNGFIGCSD